MSEPNEICVELAKLARERLATLQDLQWRGNLITWGLFAGGAGIILSRESWQPDSAAIFVGAIIAIPYVIGYYFWARYASRKYDHFDKVIEHWTDQAIALSIRPAPPSVSVVKAPEEEHARWYLNAQLRTQFAITCFIAILFVAAIAHRVHCDSSSDANHQKITIEGYQSVTTDKAQLKKD